MPRDRRKGRRWSYTAGAYPHQVRVYERTRGGLLYVAVWDPGANGGKGGERKRSLGHSDRERATAFADEQTVKLRAGLDRLRGDRPSVQHVFRLYRLHRTPDKGASAQAEDDRQLELWRRYLGADYDLSKLSRREWDAFKRQRSTGAIGSRGESVPNPKERRKVGNRSVQKDLVFLRAVCHWGLDFRDDAGRFLLERDPTRGLDVPREKNPKRPVATHDRVDAIRKVYRRPTMRSERAGKRYQVESYLPEIFEVVVGTGRRITAVCSLRSESVDLVPTEEAPWGAIVWPADTDKMGKEWRCPVSQRVADALRAAMLKRGAAGPGWLFPRPGDPSKPTRYEEASAWLREAEGEARLTSQEGSLWHAYRRLWACSRKDLPDVDVAQAGGWSSLEALKMAYQRPDAATMLRVVTHETELREAR
ncbi:tyrosine-type recombinase/integrase [Gemmatimonadota bacterium]